MLSIQCVFCYNLSTVVVSWEIWKNGNLGGSLPIPHSEGVITIRLLCCSDIHGDISTFEILTRFVYEQRETIDLVICAGDLLMTAFDNKTRADFKTVSLASWQMRHAAWSNLPLSEFARRIIAKKKQPKKIKKLAQRYIELLDIATENMRVQYMRFKELFDAMGTPVLIVPGNYDSHCMMQFFETENIHLQTTTIGRLQFAGYGGANVIPAHIPEDLLFIFDDEDMITGNSSGPYTFLSSQRPDVAIVHTPPYGCCDKVGAGMNMMADGTGGDGHAGSLGIRKYVLEYQPQIVIAGHIHEAVGVEKLRESYVINPGNLGRFYTRNYGTFMAVKLDARGAFQSATLCRINRRGYIKEAKIRGVHISQ